MMADTATIDTKHKRARNGKSITIEESNPSGIDGALTLNEDVVATIARMTAKDVPGIYAVGKSPLIGLGSDATRGVQAEVGFKEAAFDLDVVIDYGVDLPLVARTLRERTAKEVAKMAGRDVVEINIHVVDIKMPDDEVEEPKSEARVR